MTTKELIEYLQGFDENAPVSLLIVDSFRQIIHEVDKFGAITDMDCPAFYVETIATTSLEEYEQMELSELIALKGVIT